MDHRIGQKLTFAEDPNPFTVQAVSLSGRWLACTRPWGKWDVDTMPDDRAEYFDDNGWPEPGDCVYCVVDLTEELRGTDNAVGSLGYETREDCATSLALLESGEFEFSTRTPPIPLRIVAVNR